MRAILALEDVEFPGSESWWEDPGRLTTVVEAVQASGLCDLGAGVLDGEPASFDEPADVAAAATGWKPGEIHKLGCGAPDRPHGELEVSLLRGALALRLVWNEGYVAERGASLVDDAIALAVRLKEELEAARFGPAAAVEVLGASYPRPRPPRLRRYVALGAAASIVDLDYFEAQPALPDEIATLLDADLPSWVERSEHGRLVVFRWVDGLGDRDAVAEQRSRQEVWFTGIAELPRDPAYNEAGDYLMTPMGLAEHPDATYYDAGAETAYQTAVPAGGELPDDVAAEAESWLSAGQLPDGSPVRAVQLILPSRDAALAVREQAIALGVAQTLYIDDTGTLWDPFPAGEWLTEGG